MITGLCIGGPKDRQLISANGVSLFISRLDGCNFRYKYMSLDYLSVDGEKSSLGFWVPEDLKYPETQVIQALYDNYLIAKKGNNEHAEQHTTGNPEDNGRPQPEPD